MKVTISVKGRFHAFYHAKELQRQGYLRRLITTYPTFEVVKYGVDRSEVTSLLVHEVVERVWRRLPQALTVGYNLQHAFHELFDIRASRHIPGDTDIFVGMSSSSLHSIRRAKHLGIKTILERGSSHMLYQRTIMLEEYERLGVKAPYLTHPKLIEKELEEYEEADFIYVPSLFVKRTFLEHGVPVEKLIHVPLGVELNNFYPIPKRDSVFRVIHCGRLSIRKGVHYLLQAFFELGLPNAELWLVGPWAEEIKPFLSRFSSPAISYIGVFPEFELYKYYSQGSVFCLASIEEGLAMVQPQAMACGLPVICTTNTGGEDIVRDGRDGFIIPIRNLESLKEKILYFYENRDVCVEMGWSARERVQSGFTWTDYASKMVTNYRGILR